MIKSLTLIAVLGAAVSLVALKAAGPVNLHHWHWPLGHSIIAGDGPDIDFDDNEPTATRQMPWQGGSDLTFDIPAQITYTQGPTTSMTVTGPRRLVDRLQLDHNSLTINGSIHSFRGPSLAVAITGPSLSHFTLEAAQSLDIRNLATDTLNIEVEGAGKVTAQGTAHTLKLSIEGAGDAALEKLALADATIEIDGIGNVTAGPTNNASVEINGAGHVNLTKSPTHLHQEINGAGSITSPPGGTNL